MEIRVENEDRLSEKSVLSRLGILIQKVTNLSCNQNLGLPGPIHFSSLRSYTSRCGGNIEIEVGFSSSLREAQRGRGCKVKIILDKEDIATDADKAWKDAEITGLPDEVEFDQSQLKILLLRQISILIDAHELDLDKAFVDLGDKVHSKDPDWRYLDNLITTIVAKYGINQSPFNELDINIDRFEEHEMDVDQIIDVIAKFRGQRFHRATRDLMRNWFIGMMSSNPNLMGRLVINNFVHHISMKLKKGVYFPNNILRLLMRVNLIGLMPYILMKHQNQHPNISDINDKLTVKLGCLDEEESAAKLSDREVIIRYCRLRHHGRIPASMNDDQIIEYFDNSNSLQQGTTDIDRLTKITNTAYDQSHYPYLYGLDDKFEAAKKDDVRAAVDCVVDFLELIRRDEGGHLYSLAVNGDRLIYAFALYYDGKHNDSGVQISTQQASVLDFLDAKGVNGVVGSNPDSDVVKNLDSLIKLMEEGMLALVQEVSLGKDGPKIVETPESVTVVISQAAKAQRRVLASITEKADNICKDVDTSVKTDG